MKPSSDKATGLRLFNRADGVDGHYCIVRNVPSSPAFVEYWNKDKWNAFGELFTDKESATQRLNELLELDTLRTQNKKLIEACAAALKWIKADAIELAALCSGHDQPTHCANCALRHKAKGLLTQIRAALKEVE